MGESRYGKAAQGGAVRGGQNPHSNEFRPATAKILRNKTHCELCLEGLNPAEHLLVGKAVERASERVHSTREREVGVAESRADEVCRVRRRVTTLVVAVDRNVESHELVKAGVVIPELQGLKCCR